MIYRDHLFIFTQVSGLNDALPEIETGPFEEMWQSSDLDLCVFRRKRPAFVRLIHQVIDELGLRGDVEHVTVSIPIRRRAELYRQRENPWPGKRLHLDIYENRYLDRKLIRHEFAHEADRRNPAMLFDIKIHDRFRDCSWALDMAANISLDARLGRKGLGRGKRRAEFICLMGRENLLIFDEHWAQPPATWPAIEALACQLRQLRPDPSPQDRPTSVPARRRARPASGD